MRIRKAAALAAVVVAATGVLAACGGGTSSTSSNGSFSMYIGEPENPLIPGNTTESEGSKVLKALFTPLVTFNDSTNALEYGGVAQSVESTDNTNWTIKLKPGWTFHDGTPVTASSYTKAWSFNALSTNAYGASYFFENIDGYDQLQAPEGGKPAATELTGLKVVDDTTFTVKLKSPFAIFPITLGYTAFDPLPESFYADPTAFGKRPVGNGPFKADQDFVQGQGIKLTRYDNYSGDNKAKAAGVEFRVYTEVSTGYTDVQAGGLDIQLDLPQDAFATAKNTFGDRYAERPQPSITSLGFPTYDPRFADPRVRKAISMGIDRGAITSAIFTNTRVPADSYASPVVSGYRRGACGETCTLNVAEANKLLDEAGFDRSKPIDLWFNAGAGHDQWMTAVGNQLRTNLGVQYNLRGDLQFAQYLPLQDQKGMTGPFRSSWIMDYPSIYNFLSPLYSKSALPPAGSNATFHDNPAFDALLEQGNAAPSVDAATAEYQKAEDLLLTELPAAPLFYGLNQAVWSDRVSNVKIDNVGQIEVSEVTVK